MTRRSVIGVLLLTCVTFGIYGLYWFWATKEEMNSRGGDIPTAILMVIPLVNIYWMWEYSKGVERVSDSKMTAGVAFLLLFLLGVIGMAIVQVTFNEIADRSSLPNARVAA